MAAWIGELDASEHTLTSFAAGQGPIFHYRAAENRVERLMADTPPFGIEPALGGTSRVLALGRGDVVAVLSDGVLEARNPAGEEFGEARIEALMRSEAARSAGQLLAALREALRRFSGGIPASDDQTAVIVTRR